MPSFYPLIDVLERAEKSFDARGVIYVVKNVKDDKKYVGFTINAAYARMRSHVYAALEKGCKFTFSKALREHGIESFVAGLIETGHEELSVLKDLEIKYVAELATLRPLGYNMTKGGEGGITRDMRSEEEWAEIGKNISAKRKGVPCPLRQREKLKRPVLQIDRETGDVIARFDSYTSAFNTTKINNISLCCHGKLPHAGGFIWQFADERREGYGKWSQEKRDAMSERSKKSNKLARPVQQLDPESGAVIATFSSTKDVRETLGFKTVDTCARKGIIRYGFAWRYVSPKLCDLQ